MISRAASRTSSEAPAPFSVPSITAFSFSRVRSDAGILSIGVLLSQRPAQYRSSLIANQARVHPNPFPSKLRTSPFFNRFTPSFWGYLCLDFEDTYADIYARYCARRASSNRQLSEYSPPARQASNRAYPVDTQAYNR